MFTVPAVILTYGKSKSGKSASAGASFPRGLFVAREDQVKCVSALWGYKPTLAPPVQTFPDVIKLIKALGTSKNRDQFDGIVIDDGSLIAEATIRHYERNTRNGYGAWSALRDDVLDLREAARGCGLHVLFNFHERQPESRDGKFYRGGPSLPSKNLTDAIPVMADTVLHSSIEVGRVPWAGVYVCDPMDPAYVSGDRHGVAPRIGPMNEAELLRAAGYTVRRLAGLEWQDDVAEHVANATIEGKDKGTIARAFREKAEKMNLDPKHALWALRDGFDRADFRRHKLTGGWGAYE